MAHTLLKILIVKFGYLYIRILLDNRRNKGALLRKYDVIYEGHFLTSGNNPIKSRLACAYTCVIYQSCQMGILF